MNKPVAYKTPRVSGGRAAVDKFSLDVARHAYLASPRRVDLAVLIKRFESSPVDLDICGDTSKRK